MAQNLNELKQAIIEKNKLLRTISREDNSTHDKANQVKSDLDKLLFRYLKSLRVNENLTSFAP